MYKKLTKLEKELANNLAGSTGKKEGKKVVVTSITKELLPEWVTIINKIAIFGILALLFPYFLNLLINILNFIF